MRPYRLPIIRIPIRQQIPPSKLSMEPIEKRQEIVIPTISEQSQTSEAKNDHHPK
jgi:hypothetical protein